MLVYYQTQIIVCLTKTHISSVDIDECVLSPCHPEQDCYNELGSFTCVWQPCKEGYERNETAGICEDIDECAQGLDCGDEMTCINTRGGHRCESIVCETGYERNSDGDCEGTKNFYIFIFYDILCPYHVSTNL